MPAKAPYSSPAVSDQIRRLAAQIRCRRIALVISAEAAALSAGMSRMTWHRIEKAEPSVTLGAYVSAMEVLGLQISAERIGKPTAPGPTLASVDTSVFMIGVRHPFDDEAGVEDAGGNLDRGDGSEVPALIALDQFPQLRQIAWHVRDGYHLTPEQALNLYERNRRHLRLAEMSPEELALYRALTLSVAAPVRSPSSP